MLVTHTGRKSIFPRGVGIGGLNSLDWFIKTRPQAICTYPFFFVPAAILLCQPHHQGNMSFAGKYEFESDENYDDFVKKIGKSVLGCKS